MSAAGQISPKGPELALAEAHLEYLESAKTKQDKKIHNSERILSILESQLNYLEKKGNNGAVTNEQEVIDTNEDGLESLEALNNDDVNRVDSFVAEGNAFLKQRALDTDAAEDSLNNSSPDENGEHMEVESSDTVVSGEDQEDVEAMDVTREDGLDVADVETSGDDSPSEDKDNSTDRVDIRVTNRYVNNTPEDSEPEQDPEEHRRECQAIRSKQRRFREGNGSPCDDIGHPGWCKHARDLIYNGVYAELSSDDGSNEGSDGTDAMSIENDAEASVDNSVDDEDELAEDTTTSEDLAAIKRAEKQKEKAKFYSAALKNKITTLKACRDELSAFIDPEIAALTHLISAPVREDKRTELEARGCLSLMQEFTEVTARVEAFVADIEDVEDEGELDESGGSGDEDGESSDSEAEENEDEHDEISDSEEEENEDEHDEATESEEVAEEEGDEALEETQDLSTPAARGPVGLFNIPILGGKRAREVIDDEGDMDIAKRSKLDHSG